MTHKKPPQKRRKRPIWVRVVFWSVITGSSTAVLSWITRGYWDAGDNIHFVEFATIVLTMAEEV